MFRVNSVACSYVRPGRHPVGCRLIHSGSDIFQPISRLICSISKSLKISGSLGSLVTKPLHETDYSSEISMVTHDEAVSAALSETGSTLARTNLSPFARCTLGLSRHFY